MSSQIAGQLFRVMCLAVCAGLFCDGSHAAERPDISDHLKTGNLATAKEALTNYLTKQPQDDLARFQLGVVQFFAAVEGLAQDSFRYGLNPRMGFVPFLRTPIKPNPNPKPIAYVDARAMIERCVNSMTEGEAALVPIKDRQLAWKLDLAAVRLDMNGDGQAAAEETLWSVFQALAAPNLPAAPPESFTIGLDSADVYWLRGYCHLIAALGEMILAYDHERLFDRTAQLFFAKPQSKFASQLAAKPADSDPAGPWDREPILDAIAFIHLTTFPLREPERLKRAHSHLLGMVESSRKSWELIEAETDNDREWIPGPGQQSVVSMVAINKERLAAWRRFLDEAEAVLNGKKLLPFWRPGVDQGVNLAKVFNQPTDFDLVLWVQGSDAIAYLEDGEKTDGETWVEFQRVFGGRFIGFAIWIN